MSFIYESIRIEDRLDVLSGGQVITTTKGDILVDNGTTTTRLPVGANGTVVMADSGKTEGIKYKQLVATDVSDFDTEVSNNTSVASNTTHSGLTNNPHSVTKAQVGLANVQDILNKNDATSAPGANDDSGSGYSIGSVWVDVTNDKAYICTDATSTSANWIETTNQGEVATATNLGSGVGVLKQKSGTIFQFKSINAGSNKVTITDDTGNDEVDINIAESNIVIGNLSGAPSGTVVGTTDTQVLGNKSLVDSTTYFEDNGDDTKRMQFQLSGIDTSTDITLTVPNESTTVAGTDATQTFTNKTWGDNLDMNSHKILNLTTPTASTDAANKEYVDSVASGLDPKDSVKVASTVDLDSNTSISGTITYSSTGGTSSRGQITATLTTTDTFTLDSITLSSSDNGARVLLKDQTSGTQNGIWTVNISGTNLTLDRATDFDEDAEVTAGAFTFVEEGTSFADCGFVLSTNNPITIGGASGTSLSFSQYSGAGQITAGTGLTKTGNTINAGGSSTVIANADTLEVNSSVTANQILLSSGSVGTASTFGALPLANSNSVSGVLGIANGGTNASSFGAGSKLVATNTGNTALETTSLDVSAIVTLTGTQTLTSKTLTSAVLTTPQINDTSADHKYIFGVSELTTNRTVTLPLLTSNDEFVFATHAVTLTNKSIDADNNTITNIANTNIKAGAGIDAIKIGGGLVSNTEFGYLNGLTSTAVGISDTVNLSNKTLIDNTTLIQNNADSNGNIQFDLSNLTTATRTLTISDKSTTLVGIDTTDTLTNKSIDSDNNTVTNIADANIKTGANINAAKIGTGVVSTTEFDYLNGLGSTAVGVSDTNTLTNKTLTSPRIQTGISDINGNEFIKLTATASAVNEITITNATAGNGSSISATGNDTNIDLILNPKGSGNVVLDGLHWPNSDGSADQVLKTDGSGNIGYADVAIANLATITTSNATETTLGTVSIGTNNVCLIDATVVGRRTDSSGEGCGFVLRSVFRNDDGTLTKIGEDKMYSRDSAWDTNCNISGTNVLIAVTGEASKTINWKVSYSVTSI